MTKITDPVISPVSVFRGTPKLDHDAMMIRNFGDRHILSADQKVERRIVYALCMHLQALGFRISSVWDGDVLSKWTAEEAPLRTIAQRTASAKQAMELIFNLDESSLRFRKEAEIDGDQPEGRNQFRAGEHGVLLIGGNHEDIISDWGYYDDDRDGFNAAMERFDSDLYA